MSWEIITSLAQNGFHRYDRRYIGVRPKPKTDFETLDTSKLKYNPKHGVTTFKTAQGDFYTFIQDEYNDEIFKYLKDFIEGKIDQTKLLELIEKFKKPSKNEELSLVKRQLCHLDSQIDKDLIDKFGLEEKFSKIKHIIKRAQKGSLEDQAILKELQKRGEFDVLADEYIYRYIGDSELDKILSNQVVEANEGGFSSKAGSFDVMSNPHSAYAPYRVKFRIPITSDKISYHGKSDYYHYDKSSYYPIEANTVTVATQSNAMQKNIGEVVHTSPIETVQNFIDKFVAPLRRYHPKEDLLLSEDNMFRYVEYPLHKILSSNELEKIFTKEQIELLKDIPLKYFINRLNDNNPTIREQTAKLLEFLTQKYGIDFSKQPQMHRFVGQAEKDLITAGKKVNSGVGGNNSHENCFDVTSDPYLDFNNFRVNLKRNTASDDVSYHRQETYYHLNKPQYDIQDVESIDSRIGKGYFRISK